MNTLPTSMNWRFVICLLVAGVMLMAGIPTFANDHEDDDDYKRDRTIKFCTNTTTAAFKACRHEVKDDFWIALGNCNNLADKNDRVECETEAKEIRAEDLSLCKDQAEARNDICGDIGEAPYDPEIDPAKFVDPLEIGNSIAPNSYFPLVTGTTKVFVGGPETITVTVTAEVKDIMGVPCIVVKDIVEEDGEIIEDTDDWLAQDVDGNVWYFGEIAQEFEDGELVSLDGSWKHGVDGAKAGILMKTSPQVGDIYRQEFFLGDAEDMGEVLSITGTESVPAASCANDCVLTRDWTPIEHDVNEHKYYSPGIGVILEVNPETGERVELVEITTP